MSPSLILHLSSLFWHPCLPLSLHPSPYSPPLSTPHFLPFPLLLKLDKEDSHVADDIDGDEMTTYMFHTSFECGSHNIIQYTALSNYYHFMLNVYN